jgi:osmotically-inducible protein OsmY
MELTRMTALMRMLAVTCAAAALPGCAALLVGGAVVGSAVVATDRRSSGTQIDDQAIELKSGPRIKELVGSRGHVNVVSYNRVVLITGEVPTDQDKAALEQAITQIEHVRSVVSELAVMPPSDLADRSNDTFLTSKAKASLIEASDISATSFKVLTERGTVYLMGRVTEREAERATEVVRSIRGVQKVVRVVETIQEDERARLLPVRALPPEATTSAVK